jgi:hypothetical protein
MYSVHEYGGGTHCVHAGTIYFTTNNGIYRQAGIAHLPDALVEPDPHVRYAEPTFANVSVRVWSC